MRVIEKKAAPHTGETESAYAEGTTANRLALLRQAARECGEEYTSKSTTTGWHLTCDCFAGIDPDQLDWNIRMGLLEYAPVPCLILDPFCGWERLGGRA